ncbi:MAG TPA: hypothetical protein VKP64_09505 [Mycobacteriales bacterium]|nr:hypothetical protein [Mycobacteriales bacterium]
MTVQIPERLDVLLELLDRQLADTEGRLAGKVDDLELTVPDDGGPPVVTAILSGPQALGPRIGGRLGQWMVAVARRLHPDADAQPARIDFAQLARIGPRVLLTAPADTPNQRLETWVRTHLVGRIPGAGHADV